MKHPRRDTGGRGRSLRYLGGESSAGGWPPPAPASPGSRVALRWGTGRSSSGGTEPRVVCTAADPSPAARPSIRCSPPSPQPSPEKHLWAIKSERLSDREGSSHTGLPRNLSVLTGIPIFPRIIVSSRVTPGVRNY